VTIRWRKGMTFAEFEAMIAAHRAEEAAARRRRLPVDDDVEAALCEHPFERLMTEIHGRKIDGGVRITVDYNCGDCNQFLGHERKGFKV
jgi:hypothetical protein